MTAPVNTSKFTITSGNCGTSKIWKPTFDDCIVIQSPSNLERRVALKFFNTAPSYFEVRFFEDQSNTYKHKKTLIYETSRVLNNVSTGTTIRDIINFLENNTNTVESGTIENLCRDIKNFISNTGIFTSEQKEAAKNLLNLYYDTREDVRAGGGGSHKRYRKSCKSRKYQSRKQSRRHFQRRKRTHRHKSRRSRK